MSRSRWFSGSPCIPAILLLLAGCAAGPDDPGLQAMRGLMKPGDRLLLLRVLDPDEASPIAAVVGSSSGVPELRIYERKGSGYVVAHASHQGDRFHNLTVEDLTGDGRDDLIATWTGGQLEIVEALSRSADGAWVTLFQNAGQRVERRYAPDGSAEFVITSRTFEEAAGQAPTYGATTYRWNGTAFSDRAAR